MTSNLWQNPSAGTLPNWERPHSRHDQWLNCNMVQLLSLLASSFFFIVFFALGRNVTIHICLGQEPTHVKLSKVRILWRNCLRKRPCLWRVQLTGGKYGCVCSQHQRCMGFPVGSFQSLPSIWFCLIDAMSKRDVRLHCDFGEQPFSNRFQWGVASWWLCIWTSPFAPRRLEQNAGVVAYAPTLQLGDAILASYSIGPGWPFCFSPAPRAALRFMKRSSTGACDGIPSFLAGLFWQFVQKHFLRQRQPLALSSGIV